MSPQELLRLVRRHRGPVAGVLAALAVLLGLPSIAPASGATSTVVVAAHDLAAGTRLSSADLRTTALPAAAVPGGATSDPQALLGSAVAGPVRQGEPLTDARLIGAGLVHAPGLVAAPVRVADAASAALVRAGDRVDVLAAATSSDHPALTATTVARGLQVLAVPAGGDQADGGLVVLAATADTAARLAAAAVGSRLSLTLLPPA